MNPPFLVLLLLFLTGAMAYAAPPRLVVILVGDQVRADYLERYRNDLAPKGLQRFREQGVYFTNAAIDFAQTVTAPGHVLIGSGLYPSQSGIVGNRWYDAVQKRIVLAPEVSTDVARPPAGRQVRLRYFKGRSLAERWHAAWPGGRVVSVSYKARAALLLAGPGQDEALWWDENTPGFRSYGPSPKWLAAFNHKRQTHKKRNYRNAQEADDWTAALAIEIIDRLKLGRRGKAPDLLAISFSAMDMVGHRYGPDSKKTKEAFLNLDRNIAKLIGHLEGPLGSSEEVLWVFSSDHGVTPVPPMFSGRRVSFRIQNLPMSSLIEAAVAPFIYLKPEAKDAAVRLKRELLARQGVEAAWTRQEIESGAAPLAVRKGYWAGRSGDLWVTLKPGFIFSEYRGGTTHGQPTEDDAHVPLAFYGNGVLPAERQGRVSPVVVAPTILKRLGVSVQGLRAPVPLEESAISRVAFGSCLRQDRPQPIWDAVLAGKPELFIFLGDNIYANTRDPAVMRQQYAALAAQPGFQRLQKEVPRILATWDDHDYGENNAGADYPMQRQSREIFLDFWKAPAGSPRRERLGIYDAAMYGPPGRRLQVILLDLRTFKKDGETLMGGDQWRWLEGELRRPAELRFVASSIQAIPHQHGWEKWADFPEERRRLLKLLQSPGVGPVVLLSGDRHLAEISCLPAGQAGLPLRRLCEITSSNMNTSPGGFPNERNRYRTHTHPFRKRNFGRIEINWTRSVPSVRLHIVNESGGHVQELRMDPTQHNSF